MPIIGTSELGSFSAWFSITSMCKQGLAEVEQHPHQIVGSEPNLV